MMAGAAMDRAKRRLDEYFDRDELKRFKMERSIGEGASGNAWKVSYRPYTEDQVRASIDQRPNPEPVPEVPEVQHIILKTSKVGTLFFDDQFNKEWPGEREDLNEEEGEDFDPYNADDSIGHEKAWLRKFRFSKHVVKLIEPPMTPFNRIFPGLRRRMTRDDFMFLEYLENGSMGDFLEKMMDWQGVARIPNRMLWRCFLCLIRACIAMAWPPTEQDAGNNTEVIESTKDVEARGIVHDDLHVGNVMFGPLINDPDEPEHHASVPMLKMIDFGRMYEREDRPGKWNQPTGVTDNIFAISILMVNLIEGSSFSAYVMSPSTPNILDFQLHPGGATLQTTATSLLENGRFPLLDPLLRGYVCACASPHPNQRPPLANLATAAMAAIRNHDQAWYAANLPDAAGDESDDNVEWFVQNFLFSAPTMEQQAAPGGNAQNAIVLS
ncbi:hypothetical protein F4810DRAFT_600515 [Camillea tinctor]|nr:hypothetical protein F4810DRAFT_600515 [Camillea tinctor]